jgi:hypothetical protein
MPKSLLLVVCVVLLPTILGLAWFVGLFLELEYPYSLQIWQAQTATTPGGIPAKTLLARSYPGSRLHWHMCSYCYDRAHRAGNLAHVQVRVPRQKDVFLYFAYHQASNQLVAMSDRTAALHPDFLPPGDHLVPLGSSLGNGETFVIPSSWKGKR